MVTYIKCSCLLYAQGVEKLIALNEASQELCGVYDKIKHCEVSLLEGQRLAGAISCGDTDAPDQAGAAHHQHQPAGDSGDADLLGMGDMSPFRAAPAPAPAAQPSAHPVNPDIAIGQQQPASLPLAPTWSPD